MVKGKGKLKRGRDRPAPGGRAPASDADRLPAIWAAVAAIPRGRVASYGEIALRAGFPRRARLVGHALRAAPDDMPLPWHRVVNARGAISFPQGSVQHAEQRQRLEAEGVRFERGCVTPEFRGSTTDDLDELLWKPR